MQTTVARIVFVLLACSLFGGCGNTLRTTIAPEYQGRVTPIERIGVGGAGASNATQSFLEVGYQPVDVGISPSDAVTVAAARNLRFVAIADATDTSQAVWSGMFTFGMRVSEVSTGSVVWTGSATYGQGGVFISVQKSTQAAFSGLIRDFAKTFPPVGGIRNDPKTQSPAE